MEKPKRPTRRRALEAIAQELEVIENEFAWQGFEIPSDTSEESKIEAGPEEDSESESEEGDDGPIWAESNAEDLEVAIDVFVSNLIKAKIHRPRANTTPYFSDVFLNVFGADHRITQLADAFEEAVQGYFGSIHYEDMQEARQELIEIRTILNEELTQSRGQ